jgi:hypothetical protein
MFEGGISHRLTYEELLKLLVEVEAVIRPVYTVRHTFWARHPLIPRASYVPVGIKRTWYHVRARFDLLITNHQPGIRATQRQMGSGEKTLSNARQLYSSGGECCHTMG